MTENDSKKGSTGMRNRRGVIVFLIGLVLGAVLMIAAQPFVGSRLPEAVSGRRESVEGPVAAKQRKEGALLLTVVTPAGALLATFEKQVDEIDLLVEIGDTVRLTIPAYEPFLRDPRITWVGKPGTVAVPSPQEAPGEAPADSLGLEGSPADSLQADSTAREQASRWYD